jgi:hypothetical protein
MIVEDAEEVLALAATLLRRQGHTVLVARNGEEAVHLFDRAPDIDFEQGGTLFDRLRHEYFTLLVMPGGVAPVVEHLQRWFRPILNVEKLPPSDALARRYGPADGRLYLIRPDGYIGFKCAADEAPLLEAKLTEMGGG